MFAVIATACISCKKDNDTGTRENYHLLGVWEDTSPFTSPMNWVGPIPRDRYTFKTSEAYFKFYLGDIGEEGKFELVLTSDPTIIQVRLNRNGLYPSDTLLIEWISRDLIKISDNSGIEREFKRI